MGLIYSMCLSRRGLTVLDLDLVHWRHITRVSGPVFSPAGLTLLRASPKRGLISRFSEGVGSIDLGPAAEGTVTTPL